jgi:signal transduction histidine kinase
LLLLNIRIFEALFYGAGVLAILLIVAVYLSLQTQRRLQEQAKILEDNQERLTFELDTRQKAILNQDNKIAGLQKQLEQAQSEIQQRNVIFSDTNVYLEREVRKQTQEIRQANERLQKVVDELDMFIYKTAHDIRGPLARLMGLTQIAMVDVSDQKAREYIGKLGIEANNLSYILARLSLVYEINHAEVRQERIHPEALVEKVLSDIKNLPGYPLMRFELATEPNLSFDSDPVLLEFIVKNLLENAVRFRRELPEHESVVKVHLHREKKNFLLRVVDNGIGISPTDALVIFDMFSRAAGIHKSSGLGLYMTKLAVEKLSGEIELLSGEVGQTEFKVQIPVG